MSDIHFAADRWVRSLCIALLAVAAFSFRSALAADTPSVHERANDFLGLLGSDLVEIEFDAAPGIDQTLLIPVNGETLAFEVSPYSLRSDQYQLLIQVPGGALEEVEPGAVRTVRGSAENGAVFGGAIYDEGVFGVIRFPDDVSFWVEPIFDRIEGAGPMQHVIYADEDVLSSGGSCATAAANVQQPEHPTVTDEGSGCSGLPCEVELACDADWEFHNIWGGVTGVENRINLIMNAVNTQYLRDVDVVHRITTILVRTTFEDDPYVTNDPGDLVAFFRTHWLANHANLLVDEHQLFTGVPLAGPPIGIAFGIGLICGSSSFCVVENNNTFNCATDLSAHELGHLWNGSHCSCPTHTMNASLTCSNRFHPTFTIPSLVSHRQTRPCLDSLAPATTLPFFDDFEGVVNDPPDPTLWYDGGATISDQGAGEPSGSTSMRINGIGISANSASMDATGLNVVGVEYWWQRTGDSNGSPEPNEDLILEYKNTAGFWVEADRQLGDGPDDLPFEKACAVLGDDVDKASLQIRFRMLLGQPSDNFFVDDVSVIEGEDFIDFVMQPETTCACEVDGSAEFSVTVDGDGPFGYQWFNNGIEIPGATSDTLVIDPVEPGDFGPYYVEASNACGATLESNTVQLLETGPVVITGHPQDSEFSQGGTIALFASASGACADYQWYFNDAPIPDATGSFLFIANATCDDQGCYHVVVSNDCNEEVSETAAVTITGCGPFDCDSDTTPPEIVHGDAQPGETRPFTGYVDPRSESTNGVDEDLGITQFEVLFSEPVEDIGGGGLTTAAFSLSETGGGTPPSVISVDDSNMPLVVVEIDRPITLQEWTTLQASVQDLAETPNVIVNNGDQGPGVAETDRIDVAFLPADIDQNGMVTPFDLLTYRQIVNGSVDPTPGIDEDYADIDRNDAISPFDLLALRQLINGIVPSTRVWSGLGLNNTQP